MQPRKPYSTDLTDTQRERPETYVAIWSGSTSIPYGADGTRGP
jgi:hypothetical protein